MGAWEEPPCPARRRAACLPGGWRAGPRGARRGRARGRGPPCCPGSSHGRWPQGLHGTRCGGPRRSIGQGPAAPARVRAPPIRAGRPQRDSWSEKVNVWSKHVISSDERERRFQRECQQMGSEWRASFRVLPRPVRRREDWEREVGLHGWLLPHQARRQGRRLPLSPGGAAASEPVPGFHDADASPWAGGASLWTRSSGPAGSWGQCGAGGTREAPAPDRRSRGKGAAVARCPHARPPARRPPPLPGCRSGPWC